MSVNTDPPCIWRVERDCYPNEMYTIRNQYGCTALPNKGDFSIGFYRTKSLAKANRDCERMNKKEQQHESESA